MTLTDHERRGFHQAAWCIGSLFLFSSALAHAKPVEDRSYFCVQSPSGALELERYPPLVDLHQTQLYTQIIYTDTWLSQVRVRKYVHEYGMDFDYKFDDSGHLTALKGTMRRWGRWVARADLFPIDGVLPAPQLTYAKTLTGGAISEPPDGRYYEAEFKTAPVFMTTEQIPCAAMLKQRVQEEKSNATQK